MHYVQTMVPEHKPVEQWTRGDLGQRRTGAQGIGDET